MDDNCIKLVKTDTFDNKLLIGRVKESNLNIPGFSINKEKENKYKLNYSHANNQSLNKTYTGIPITDQTAKYVMLNVKKHNPQNNKNNNSNNIPLKYCNNSVELMLIDKWYNFNKDTNVVITAEEVEEKIKKQIKEANLIDNYVNNRSRYVDKIKENNKSNNLKAAKDNVNKRLSSNKQFLEELEAVDKENNKSNTNNNNRKETNNKNLNNSVNVDNDNNDDDDDDEDERVFSVFKKTKKKRKTSSDNSNYEKLSSDIEKILEPEKKDNKNDTLLNNKLKGLNNHNNTYKKNNLLAFDNNNDNNNNKSNINNNLKYDDNLETLGLNNQSISDEFSSDSASEEDNILGKNNVDKNTVISNMSDEEDIDLDEFENKLINKQLLGKKRENNSIYNTNNNNTQRNKLTLDDAIDNILQRFKSISYKDLCNELGDTFTINELRNDLNLILDKKCSKFKNSEGVELYFKKINN